MRGYPTGVSDTSTARAYERGERTFCGHALPDGLRRHDKLPESLLTPSTKAPKGQHDISVSRDWLVERGLIDREALRPRSSAAAWRCSPPDRRSPPSAGSSSSTPGHELGVRPDGEIVLIDEIHTPDSSRYWYADSYAQAMARGEDPRSLDKEYLRRRLVAQGFRGEETPPVLPDEIRAEAARRYIEVHESSPGGPSSPTSNRRPRACGGTSACRRAEAASLANRRRAGHCRGDDVARRFLPRFHLRPDRLLGAPAGDDGA